MGYKTRVDVKDPHELKQHKPTHCGLFWIIQISIFASTGFKGSNQKAGVTDAATHVQVNFCKLLSGQQVQLLRH